MPTPTYTLTVSESFSASHQLRNYGGKCERMHGHNFGVEVAVSGTRLSEDTHILMDFKALRKLLKETLEDFDHRHLNEMDCFAEHNPSSENIAAELYTLLAARLPKGVALDTVTVSEKPGQMATYSLR